MQEHAERQIISTNKMADLLDAAMSELHSRINKDTPDDFLFSVIDKMESLYKTLFLPR